MKKITKLSLVIALVLEANIKVFAASGFEFALNVPLGASFGIFIGETTFTYPGLSTIAPAINSEVGFDAGVHAQIGYMIDFGAVGLSLLGDLGYSYDSYRMSFSLSSSVPGNNFDMKSYYSMYMHNFQIGILPKLNFGNFAIGIGAGVKIPMAGTIEAKTEANVNGQQIDFSQFNGSTKYVSSDFKTRVIPYIKATFDYSFFFNDRMAFVLGAYFGYDFGLAYKNNQPLFNDDSRLDSFDIGVNLGFKFGPRVGY
ncbi:hypothetical protein BRSU_2508 [Brachyspira suanatina]|uniref:Serpentine_recp domain containing protein n=1 Tax=Brachyspira suanatina TaxID=381802 RepID=A0A0G4KA64_9SPIR|nr:hypothetical protein [Brachyspira suanatina]CRF35215.1 hypothetical protein BRSU_2508 [Brachyspira suanatina]